MGFGWLAYKLSQIFPYRLVRTDIQHERVIRNPNTGKTQVDEVVHGMMAYNPETGELEPFGTWTQEQTFEGGINLPLNQRVSFGDGDEYIVSPLNNYIDFYCNDLLRQRMTPGLISYYPPFVIYNFIRVQRLPGGDPAPIANSAIYYSRDVAGDAHALAISEAGNIFDLTPGGAPYSGTFNNADGDTVTVIDGKITDVS